MEHRVRRQESGVRIQKKSNQNFVLDNYWLLATNYRLLDSLIADRGLIVAEGRASSSKFQVPSSRFQVFD